MTDNTPHVVPYGSHPDQFMEVWEPTTGPPPAGPRGTAVLIHGGYWRHRYNLELMHPMSAHLAGRGWRVHNIEYRRIEERDGVWDDMSADVRTAVGRAGPVRPVVVIGHSAGGHLALWATHAVESVDAVVALAPVADLAEADRRSLSDGAVRELLGSGRSDQPDRYRAASPIELLPLGRPQLVVHGEADDAVPPEMAVAYVEAARNAGDDVRLVAPPDVDHFHIIDPQHPVWELIDTQLDQWANYAPPR